MRTRSQGSELLAGRVERLPDDVKVPHMGWNTVIGPPRISYIDGLTDGTLLLLRALLRPWRERDDGGHDGLRTDVRRRRKERERVRDAVPPEKSGESGLAVYERFVRSIA